MEPSKSFHPDDIVAKKSDLKALAVVERTTHDIDTHVPFPGNAEHEPINHDRSISHSAYRQFLRDGIPPKDTILVRWRDEESVELLPTSKVKLLDRSLLIGDIVKRHANDAMSGCVINTFTSCNLQPMCDITYNHTWNYKGILPPGKFDPGRDQFYIWPRGRTAELTDIPAEELTYSETISEDDLVILRDWIGRVEALANAIQIRLCDNCVVEIMDEKVEHADGSIGDFDIGDVLKTKKGVLRMGRWIFGQYNPNTPPIGTVVNLRTIQAEVAWLEKRIGSSTEQEPPAILEAAELESPAFQVYDRTRRPISTDNHNFTVSNSEPEIRLNLRVRFKDLTGACLKYSTSDRPIPRLERTDNLGFDLNVFNVTTFHTKATVQWQDLTITTERSTDLVPDGSIDDEHATWPGEIAHTLSLHNVPGMDSVVQPERVGVVQAVNARERMAQIKWSPGSYVRYAKDPDDDGAPPAMIERCIGDVSLLEEEVSLYDIEAPASMNVRRGDIVLIANPEYNEMKDTPTDMTWLGEIVDTRLDGKLTVRLGAASEVRDVILRREETVVAVRSDGTGQLDEWQQDEMAIDDGSSDFLFSDDDESMSDVWDSDMEREAAARYEDENGMVLDESDVVNEEWESAEEDNEDEARVEMHDAPEHQTPPTSYSATPTHSTETATPAIKEQVNSHPSSGPEAYEVFDDDVPLDHHYRNEPTTTTSGHAKRTQKEHKILRNPATLPEGVYIRAWESRLDLLRILLIGPSETPYANAPFVIDAYLPSHFPQEPPQLHFHSWPAISSIGSLGRVNPNLYEDGKICLSLLGTWDGAKGESWSAARSTLLQVIVSLLGLVLVREPYYNEAGYESLVGEESSKRPSALYSERVFLRAKGFLITALSAMDRTPGLQKLEDILHWLYKSDNGPRLLKAMVKEVSDVLEKSDGIREPDGLTIMSKGAAISARRLLDWLNQLAAES